MCIDQLWIKVQIKYEFMNDALTNLWIFYISEKIRMSKWQMLSKILCLASCKGSFTFIIRFVWKVMPYFTNCSLYLLVSGTLEFHLFDPSCSSVVRFTGRAAISPTGELWNSSVWNTKLSKIMILTIITRIPWSCKTISFVPCQKQPSMSSYCSENLNGLIIDCLGFWGI